MEMVTPRIVIHNDSTAQDAGIELEVEPADSTTASEQPPPPPATDKKLPPTSRPHQPTTTFAKLVHTVQLIKKWTATTENESEEVRQAFLTRFKPGGPNIDDAYVNNNALQEEAGEDRENKIPWWKPARLFYFDPMENKLYYWLLVITIAVLYNSFVIIARQTFNMLQTEVWQTAVWMFFDYTSDLIYIIDMFVQFRTGYLFRGLFVTESGPIAKHYIKSKWFKLDVISLLPFDLLYAIPGVGTAHVVVRLLRILRMHRMIQFFDRTESRTNWPNVFRLVALMLYITLIIHWNACFYYLISQSIGFGSDRWVYPAMNDTNGTLTEFASLSRQYLFSLYWSTLTLTTIGEVPGPVTEWEYVFVILDFLVGVLIFATIVGMVGGIITNMNARRTEFQSRLDNIKQYMRYRTVGKDLQRRVIQWFDYVWTNNLSLNEEAILQSLPDKLRAEIAIHVHFETLRRVEIFEECEVGFLEELVLKLKPQVFSPGDFICRKGDIGKEMYIIKHGQLEVIGDDMKSVLAILGEGGYFGEISILNISGCGNRRTANVRSVGYSDLFCLSKSDLLEAVSEYPEIKNMLEERGRKTLLRDGTLDELTFKAMENISSGAPKTVTGELKRRTEKLEANLEQLQNRFTRLLGEYNTAQMKLKQRIYTLEVKDRETTAKQ